MEIGRVGPVNIDCCRNDGETRKNLVSTAALQQASKKVGIRLARRDKLGYDSGDLRVEKRQRSKDTEDLREEQCSRLGKLFTFGLRSATTHSDHPPPWRASTP